MDFRDHRPQKHLDRSERPLVKIAADLTNFLFKAQRSLRHKTLHLSSRQRQVLASILVEFAEDVSQNIGLWHSVEYYNLDFFGTPLPCMLAADEVMETAPIHPRRVQFLLWTLYSILQPDLLLAPSHADLARLALQISEFLAERFAHLQYDSGVKTFLATPHRYGWEVKRKLIWLGQHSYLFRMHCAAYIQDHGGKADVPTMDDFLCQETTNWSGLGVIDILAATLHITDSQRHDLRQWYERHTAYFRVVSLRQPYLDVLNLLNEQPYTIYVGEIGDQFRLHDIVFGGVVPWDGVWYWSGLQRRYAPMPEDRIQQLTQDFRRQASAIIYRYCAPLAQQARDVLRKYYQEFVDYHGTDLVVYPTGVAMAADMRAFLTQHNASKPQDAVAAARTRHALEDLSPRITWAPQILEATDGVGVYFNPEEGQEIMTGFDDVLSGFQKRGRDLTEDEAERIRRCLSSENISPQFINALVHKDGAESIAAAFVIPPPYASHALAYLLRRYKGHFYRQRYPTITLV